MTQGAPPEMEFYYQGIAWFYSRHPHLALDTLQRTVHLRSTSSFSMVFAVLFYRLLLSSSDQEDTFLEASLDAKERLRMKLYLAKGVGKLLEYASFQLMMIREDVKRDGRMFCEIFATVRDYALGPGFLRDCEVSQLLFDECLYLVSRHMVFYSGEGALTEQIYKMAEVYLDHMQRCLTEEERAEKEIEHSYIMLHIYKNP